MNDGRPSLFGNYGVGFFWVLFASAVAIFTAAELSIAAVNGFWIDEYFSTWISDPTQPFLRQFLDDIITDTNPPFYFTALRLVRILIPEPRSAYIALDLICLAPTLVLTLWTASRARILRTGLVAISAFLLSGPVLDYFPEGRTYFGSMCVAFAAAWLAGLVVVDRSSRESIIAFAILGVLSALTHVFTALFAGSLAAGLVGVGLLTRRRDLVVSGLVLGGAATLTFIAWVVFLPVKFGRVTWIIFNRKEVLDAIWRLRHLQLGPGFMVLPLAALAGFGLWTKSTRALTGLFVTAFVLFALLPIIISFKIPIVVGRYWAIGAPSLVVLIAFLMRGFALQGDRPGRIATAVAAVFLVAASGFGFAAARRYTIEKSVWLGAPQVALLARSCAPGSVHVAADFFPAFALASGLPSKTFVDADAPGSAPSQVADMTCPVVGWREHADINADMSDDALVARLGLKAAPGEVTVVRHTAGYVVLKAGAAPSP